MIEACDVCCNFFWKKSAHLYRTEMVSGKLIADALLTHSGAHGFDFLNIISSISIEAGAAIPHGKPSKSNLFEYSG
jgi:hypothetical protein